MANDTKVNKPTDTLVTKPWNQGMMVKAVVFPDDTSTEVGKYGVEAITAVIEADGSPWFCIWMDGEIRYKYNSRHLAAVVHL